MVIHKSLLMGMLVTVALISGCAPVYAPISESGSASPPVSPVPPPPEPEFSPPVAVPDDEDRRITPSSPVQVVPSGAVSSLLEEAWRLNEAGDYDRSNAVAERALRINHTEPEVYLVMASNYFAMTQLGLAEQLARQGLPLAGKNPGIKADLQSLLSRIGALR
ncbi:tetratricopeptide repeat protein [Porticoccus sp.]|uniref:tetratricopeptide repeat protein n=1 Tax=Porticoccus sp. TaxID=2024853 RepID=UPI003F69E901